MKVKELIEQLKGSEESKISCMVYKRRSAGVTEILEVGDILILENGNNGDNVMLGIEVKSKK